MIQWYLSRKGVKVGFCFLLKDGLSHSLLWEHFLLPAPPESYGLYVHAKTSIPSPVLAGSRIDPSPLPTAWGDRSLVEATQRLFLMAVDDGCDAMVLVSGDMLPLQSFDWVQNFCRQSRCSIQPQLGLNERQVSANSQRFELIAPFLAVPVNSLRKQNMFFVMTRKDFYAVNNDAIPAEFPLKFLADEYYWVNHLIRIEAGWLPSNVIFCNPDPTRTQALLMDLTPELLASCRAAGYGFIRKVLKVHPQAWTDLQSVYASSIDRRG